MFGGCKEPDRYRHANQEVKPHSEPNCLPIPSLHAYLDLSLINIPYLPHTGMCRQLSPNQTTIHIISTANQQTTLIHTARVRPLPYDSPSPFLLPTPQHTMGNTVSTDRLNQLCEILNSILTIAVVAGMLYSIITFDPERRVSHLTAPALLPGGFCAWAFAKVGCAESL